MNKQDLLKVQTCVLKVNIHCDGCKQKVKKILQKVEGVFSVKIDSEQGKVTVAGNADPAVLLKKLSKSGKRAELWGGNVHKSLPNDFQSQFMNMMQMGVKDGGKLHKGGGGGGGGGGKDLMKGGSLPPQFKGFKDLKPPAKDQKSVKFNLSDDEGDYSDGEDYSDEDDYSDEEDYTDDEDGDGNEEEFDHKHPPSKMMMNEKMKGKGVGGGGGGGNGADMKALMMMMNEKKGGDAAHAGGGKVKNDKNKDLRDDDDDIDDDSDFDMPVMKKGGKDGKNGGGKNKEEKGKHGGGGGGGVMKSLVGLLGGGGKKKSKGGGESEKKSKGGHDHDLKHGGGNGGKVKGGGGGGGGGNNVKIGKDHGFINNGHGKTDGGGKLNTSNGGFQYINANHGGKGGAGGGGGGGPKMMGHMGPNSHINMGHHGPPMMTNYQPAQGLPAQNPGYYNPGIGQGNPYNQQQQQYMAMMMNQQQQQQQSGMHGGGEMYHPMMYARPHPAVNYANGYVPPMPPPSRANPYSHMFSDENTEGCIIM